MFGCSGEEITKPEMEKSLFTTYAPEVNPYNFCGQVHNEGLNYCIANIERSHPALVNNSLDSINTIIAEFMDFKGKQELPSSSLFNASVGFLNNIDIHYLENTLDTYVVIDSIQNVEIRIANDSVLTSQEKMPLFVYASVVKGSFNYWLNELVIESLSSEWNQVETIFEQYIIHQQVKIRQRLQLTQSQKEMVVGILLADAGGAISGAIKGALIGLVTTGCLMGPGGAILTGVGAGIISAVKASICAYITAVAVKTACSWLL